MILFYIILALTCGALNAENYGCDFESTCDSLDFDSFWGFTSASVPFAPNAPTRDHTYGNSSGHYMFFDLSSGLNYKNSVSQFKNIFNYTADSATTRRCLQFYYILSTNLNRNFDVRLVLGDNDDLVTTWFSLSNSNNTADWTLAEIELPNDAYRIKFFYNVINPPTNAKILLTLDDIFITDTCTTVGQKQVKENKVYHWCDFEKDDCRYENTMNTPWRRIMAKNKDETNPPYDHTLNSSSGSYLATTLAYTRTGTIQRVTSMTVTVPSNDDSAYCLSFYYYLTSYATDFYVFAIPLDSESDNITYKANYKLWPSIYSDPRFVFGKWSWAAVNLAPGTFRVAFLVVTNQDNNNVNLQMALDDVKVVTCPAVNKPTVVYPIEKRNYFEIKCSFEDDQCGFESAKSDFLSNWTRIDGNETENIDLGPLVDHTTGTSEGYFLSVNFSMPIVSSFSAQVLSPLVFAHAEMCFEFYYYSNADAFSGSTKSMFSLTMGGCYGAYLFMFQPYANASTLKWNRSVVKLNDPACSGTFGVGFGGSDFIKRSFAIDDIRIDRCDVINNTTVITTTASTTTTSTTSVTTATTTPIPTTETTTESTTTTTTTTTVTSAITTQKASTKPHHPNAASFKNLNSIVILISQLILIYLF